MSGEDSVGVTLAHVDPSLVSCWNKMVKQGEEYSLLLKLSKGKVVATLQCSTPVKTSTSMSSSSPSALEKKKKRKGSKKKKLEKLLAYHQRLVVEKGLPPSRLMEEHAALSTPPPAKSPSRSQFECDQCDFASDTQRGLKVHMGKSHKKTEVLRDEEHEEVALNISLQSEVTREEVGEEKGEPVSPLQPSPSSPPSNLCTDCDEEITGLTWYRLGEPWCEDCVRVYVTTD